MSDTFVKLIDPASLPGGWSQGATFSPDGGYLVITSNVKPFIWIYKRNGDVFTKLANPASLPPYVTYDAAFSPDGVYLVITCQNYPYVIIYKRNGDIFTQPTGLAVLPTGNGLGAAFSPDGTYLVITSTTLPYVLIYKRDGDTFTKLDNPSSLPTGAGVSAAFSPDGAYLAIIYQSSPYVIIYKRNGDVFTKLVGPAVLPTGYINKVTFSPDGAYLVVTSAALPYVLIYKRDGDTFTKLDDPASLPTGTAKGAAFSPDGAYLVISSMASPYVLMYKRDEDTFTKLDNPASLPTSGGQGVAFSPDGTYLVVTLFDSPGALIYKYGDGKPKGPFYLFLKSDDTCYAYQTNTMQQIVSGWASLPAADKDKNFQTAGVSELPPPTALQTLAKFKILQSPVPKSPPSYNITAVPKDQFIYALGDIDLSNCSNIDWFHTNDGVANFEAGGGKVRHLASRDQGQTWWTYDGTNWVQVIDITKAADGAFVDSRFVPSTEAMTRVISQGMTKAQFDAAPWQAWTIDVGFKAIRFGFCLSMAASTDTAFCDNLKYQYDGPCSWKVAVNGVDYEARFGNTTLELKWLTGGWKAKVNY